VPSVVKTDHKAVVALPSGATAPNGKTRQRRTFRHRTPSQNAIFLQHLAAIDLGTRPEPEELACTADPQAFYDSFYSFAVGLLDEFYP